MKRKMLLFIMVVMLLLATRICVGAYNVGDVIHYAQPTNIVAFIDGYQIMSYNVDGYTYVCAEDLRHYGLDVVYDNTTRTLAIDNYAMESTIAPHITNPEFWSIGSNKQKKEILYTDIVTYVADSYVNSYNINGATIIRFDALACFGDVVYNNDTREITLRMNPWVYNPLAKLVDLLGEEWINGIRTGMEPIAKQIYGSRATIEIYARAKGPVLVYEIYLHGVIPTATQRKQEQRSLATYSEKLKEAYQLFREACPTMNAVAMIMYDDTGAEVGGATISLD